MLGYRRCTQCGSSHFASLADVRRHLESGNCPGKRPQTPHSPKALETFRQMGTEPTDWGFTEIEWKKELRNVLTKIDCPDCHGNGRRLIMPDGTKADYNTVEAEVGYGKGDHFGWLKRKETWEKEVGAKYGKCPTCPPKRYGDAGTGNVIRMVEREIMTGYPQWADGTLFDSRFGIGCDCGLCNKTIMKSHLVPVTAKGSDGRIHGMWIGEDCAKKFMGWKNFKKDHILAIALEGETT